ncbi:MAG: adenylate/guanylate cyclase domain-containing protein [Rhizobiaceae bacterium]
MAFVTLHLVNHSLALISIDTAGMARGVLMAPWRNPVGSIVLLAAALAHIGLALLALYRRRSLVMPVKEAAQLVLGLAIPVLIAEHIIGIKTYEAMSGANANYPFVANALWVQTPLTGVKQTVAVLVIWGHGCIGVYFWLRYRPWFAAVGPYLLVFAALLPVLSLLGFVNAGRAVVAAPSIVDDVPQTLFDAVTAAKMRGMYTVYAVYGALLGLVLVMRVVRDRRERRNLVEVRYPDGRSVRVPKGFSVLEASRLAGIPHHAVCGGRGRCSTCRVRVLEGFSKLPPPEAPEQATLARIHAEPDVRLACQLRPMDDLSVIPLLSAGTSGTGTLVAAQAAPGREQDVAVLFCDIRGFTALADKRLPFDTVFLLNRYFAVVGKAIEKTGGRLDKFIGDGAMAIFGLNASNKEACRQAVAAAAAIVEDLAHVSQELAAELREPLRVAIGIHAGTAIAGSMGYGQVMGVTVIGDTVNIASRLESVAKELDASLVISSSAAVLSGIDFSAFEKRTVDIRGHSKPLKIIVVPQHSRLSLETPAGATAA